MPYRDVLQILSHENVDAGDVIDSIKRYVLSSLYWLFEDRIQFTGFFQHSLIPDFTLTLGTGKQLNFYFRLSAGSILSLVESLEPTPHLKHCIVLLGTFAELEDFNVYLNAYRDRTTILITTADILDELERLSAEVPEDSLPILQPGATGMLTNVVETWLLKAYGIQRASNFIAFVEPAARDAWLKLREASIPSHIRTSQFTLMISWRQRAWDLAKWLARHTLLQYSRLDEDSFEHHPDVVDQRFPYGPPSLVLFKDWGSSREPVLAISLSHHLSLGQNPFQPFAKAVASVESGIPFINLAPERSLVRRKDGRATIENASPLLYHAYLQLWSLTDIPAMTLAWPVNRKGQLEFDEQYQGLPPIRSVQLQQLRTIVDRIVAHGHIAGPQVLKEDLVVERIRLVMEDRRMRRGPTYLQYPPLRSAHHMPTATYLEILQDRAKELWPLGTGSVMREREFTLIARSRSEKFRSSYAGTLLLYDFAFCRYGSAPTARRRNLAMEFPMVSYGTAERRLFTEDGNEADTPEAKIFLRNCDALVFADAILIREAGNWTKLRLNPPGYG